MCGWSTQQPPGDAGLVNREGLVYAKRQDPKLLQLCVQMLRRETCRVESAPCTQLRSQARTWPQALVVSTGFGGFPASSLVLCGSFIFVISVGVTFAVTAPASLVKESNAPATWVGSCASTWVGSQSPATFNMRPDAQATAESYSQNWKLPVLVFALQNAS